MTTLTRRKLLDGAVRHVLRRLPRFPPAGMENSPLPAGVREIAEVDLERCVGARDASCSACLPCCPVGEDVIVWQEGPRIDPARCTGCGICERICGTVNPPGAILTRPRLPGEGA